MTRDGFKRFYVDKQDQIEGKYSQKFGKFFLNWRNDFRDFVRDATGYDIRNKTYNQKHFKLYKQVDENYEAFYSALDSYFKTSLQPKQREIADIMRTYGQEINVYVIQQYIDELGLTYYPTESQTSIQVAEEVPNNTLQNIITITATALSTINSLSNVSLEERRSMDNIFEDSVNGIDNELNAGNKRSDTIARTQSNMWSSEGIDENFSRNNIIRKEWLTTLDGRERPSHRLLDGEIIVMGSTFTNGLKYPTDPTGAPEETINCRCTILPVKDD